MKIKKLGAALAAVLALVVALTGCGGGGADLEKIRKDFVGTWEVYSGTFEDESFSHEDYELITELGMHATLDLDDDGDMLIDLFGVTRFEGSWKLKDETTVTLTIDGDAADATFDDDKLTLAFDGEELVFEKVDDDPNMDRDPSENSGTASGDLDDLLDDDSAEKPDDDLDDFDDADDDDADDDGDTPDDIDDDMAELISTLSQSDAYVDDVTELSSLAVPVVDDSTATINVYALGVDYEGDTGYLMEITNHTDQGFVAVSADVEVDGSYVDDDATLVYYVPANTTKKAFLFFDQDEVTVTADSSCTGQIMLIDFYYEPLAFYDFSI